MKLFRLVPVVGIILLALPHAVRAQSGVIALGPALTINPNPGAPGENDLVIAPRVGFQVTGALEFGPSLSPVAFRLEVLYDRLPYRYTPLMRCLTSGCSPQTAHQNLAAATFDVILHLSAPTTRLVPYLIAGAGVYDYYDTADGGSNAVGVGLNAGFGLRLPFLHAFVEARAHVVQHAPDCLPITFGLRF